MKGNEEDIYCGDRGQSLRPHSGGGEWIKRWNVERKWQ